jgi:hypothetical protein
VIVDNEDAPGENVIVYALALIAREAMKHARQ